MENNVKEQEVLTVSHLEKKYKNNRGIDDVSFSIKKGDIFGLLGANGAGKTTTMKVITGMIQHYFGEVLIYGKSLSDNFENSMREIGALIEVPSFYGYLSAEKNLQLAAKYYDYKDKQSREENITDMFQTVKLSQYRKDKVSKFSLGMKQRMGLALAMIGKPSLYILDEPANGLDIEGIVEIRNIILELVRNNEASFLISSHQSAELQKVCNRVGIIHNGVLKSTADMDFVLENYPSLEDYYLQIISKPQVSGGVQ